VSSIIELLVVGYVLQYVFDADNMIYMILLFDLMNGAATKNARKKGVTIKGVTWKNVLTFVFVELLTQGILLGLKSTPATPQYIIPISGMVVGNSMVLSTLFLNRFTAEVETHQNE